MTGVLIMKLLFLNNLDYNYTVEFYANFDIEGLTEPQFEGNFANENVWKPNLV